VEAVGQKYLWANATSGDGRTLIGYGVDPSGNASGWIATVPEPGRLAMLSGAAIALFGRRRPRRARFADQSAPSSDWVNRDDEWSSRRLRRRCGS
jgi:hypothetical protein